MRLIDADDLAEKETVTVYSTNGAVTDVVPVGAIRYFPTIDPVHAAGGCYCRECRYHTYDWEFKRHWCNRTTGSCEVESNEYCSYGKRREGVEDDELSI